MPNPPSPSLFSCEKLFVASLILSKPNTCRFGPSLSRLSESAALAFVDNDEFPTQKKNKGIEKRKFVYVKV